MGLSDSGKTLIFVRLLHSKFIETYTSTKENLGHILVGNVSFEQYFMIDPSIIKYNISVIIIIVFIKFF